MKIIFATGNRGKLNEATGILGEGFNLVTPADMGITEEIPETGNSLAANSVQKAKYIYDKTGCDCFADDSGLEVEILGGAPGVYTARYAGGDGHDFEANMDKLLDEMQKAAREAAAARSMGISTPHATRRAQFRTVVTLILGGKVTSFEGVLKGTIALAKSGTKGFGYDPVFIADEYPENTLAEVSLEQKNEISHRGKALRAMAEYLQTLEK